MKKQLFILILLLTTGLNVFAQNNKLVDFKHSIYKYDLSGLFIPKPIPDDLADYTINPGEPLGFFGSNYQRFYIKFLEISQDDDYPETYYVRGKSMLKENICPFYGEMKIIGAKVYEKSDIPGFKQGYVNLEYKFTEDVSRGGTGVFRGKAMSFFFIDDQENIYYDAISFFADGYSNNGFKGVWISNKSGKQYKCNWGDFRIPDSGDLDAGAGEFTVAEKYLDKGWRTFEYAKGYGYAADASEEEIKEAKKIEEKEWWEEE